MESANLFFTFIAIFSFITASTGTKVSKCTKVDAPLPEVEIKDCDQSPCTFYIGAAGVMTMKFRAPRYLERFQPKAVANVFTMDVDYPLGQDDACVGVLNTPCPLAEGEYVEYSYAMDISKEFPAVSLTLEFSLLDLERDKEAFECFRVDLQLKKV